VEEELTAVEDKTAEGKTGVTETAVGMMTMGAGESTAVEVPEVDGSD
jgi:hypothetical protein